jgi:hypothetical protein
MLAFAVACSGGPDTPEPPDPPPAQAKVVVIHESRHDTTSLPLARTPAAARLAPHEDDEGPGRIPIKTVPGQSPFMRDSVAQRNLVQHPNIPSTQRSFEGIGQGFTGPAGTFSVASAPPDTNGAVGPNHFAQVTNTDLAIFDKTGTVLLGPVPINTVFAGFGGACESTNDGDPIVQYDQFSDRWIISQFSVSAPPFQQCVAVSTSGDPLGTYNRYAFSFGNTDFNDYPKIGIWPDGYYFTFNIFANGQSFSGAQACAYDRANMLIGGTASAQCFSTGPSFGGLLPASADGLTPPPAGAPNYLLNFDANSLNLWKFHVDFANPAASTFTGPTNLPVAPFNPMCGGFGACIAQGGTTQTLDSLADRLMYRLAYRNFGDHESLVVNHSVDAGGGVAGVRWYELRNPSTTLSVFQQGTFAPDGNHRWMGSAAMDKAGDIAIGFSSSSSSSFPDIRYSGRLVDDELGTMTQGEAVLFPGGGSQDGGLSRWGDYSSLVVDPTNDCTFWFTTEYLAQSGSFNWHTRIGSFTFPSCTGTIADEFALSVSPASATVTAGNAASYAIQTELTSGSVQAIALTVSGLPAGATASFDAASIFAGESATLTVTTSAATPVGAYNLGITGTGSSSTRVTSVRLVVSPVINPSLVNGNFETGDLTGWIVGPNASISTVAHGGAFAAQVGIAVATFGDSSIAQAFPIAAGAESLSFFYSISCPDTVSFDWATATLTDFDTGVTSDILLRTCTNDGSWVQQRVDVRALVGHTVMLTLVSHDDGFVSDPTFVLYDDGKLEGPPPPVSTITNGDFETGDFTAWTQTGTTSIDSNGHGGAFSALVGATTPTNGDSTVQQTFTVPAGGGALSFFYQVHCNDTLDLGHANASLTDQTTGVTSVLLVDTCKNLGMWVKVTTDLSALAGHAVTLTLLNHDDNYPGDPTFTYFDDVTFTPASAPPSVIHNGDFETGDLSSWTIEGSASMTTAAHGGGFAAMAGAESATWGDSVVSQSFVVPASAGTLGFYYQSHCQDLVQYDWTTATLTDHTTGTTQVLLGKTCKNTGAWVEVTTSLTGLAGHFVTLSLVNHDDNYDADVTYSLFDDVTLK